MLQEMIATAEVYSIRQGRQVTKSLPATDVDYTHNSVCNKTSPEKSKRVARPPGPAGELSPGAPGNFILREDTVLR